jgi:hypothetical protein
MKKKLFNGLFSFASYPQGADSLPPPLRVVKTGKNNLKKGNYPLLPIGPIGIGERFRDLAKHIKFRTCSAL